MRPDDAKAGRARLAVAVSGGGRSLANFLDCARDARYEVSAVIASREDCGCSTSVSDAPSSSTSSWFSRARNRRGAGTSCSISAGQRGTG